MTYQETLDFMFSQLPMYHRIGAAAYKNDIQPTIDMMAALGNPERKLKSIHVAGTNGKGSVSHFLASRTGCLSRWNCSQARSVPHRKRK